MASVYQKRGHGPWYLRVKDAAGRWADIASRAKTKTEARRLAADLERKAERQRLGLDPLPTDCTLTVGELIAWWLHERCPQASYEREESRLRKNVISTPLGSVLVRHLTAPRVEDHLHELEKAGAAPASVNHVRAKLRTVFLRRRRESGSEQTPSPRRSREGSPSACTRRCARRRSHWCWSALLRCGGHLRPPRSTQACARESCAAYAGATSISMPA